MTRNTSSIQIVIAATDLQRRLNLRAALRSEPGFTVVGAASGKSDFLALRRQLRPDILLLDSALAGLVDDAVNSWPAVRIILLAATIDKAHVIQGLRLAARAIVPATASPQVLLSSIHSVLADQYWLDAESIAILVQMLRHLPVEYEVESSHQQHGLTAREGKIVAMIAAGSSNKQISQELSISERTVKHHLTSIFEKLGLSSRLQLAAFALTHRLGPNGNGVGAVPGVSSDSTLRGGRKPISAVSINAS